MSDSHRIARNAIRQGRVTASRILDGRVLLDLTLRDGEERTNVELRLPAGYTVRPRVGADVDVWTVGGNPDHLVAHAADDPGLRIADLAEGESGFRDAGGQTIRMLAGGVRMTGLLSLEIECAGAVTLDAPTIALVGGTLTHNGVNIGATHRHAGVVAGGATSGTPT